jgi:uncharacterized protein YebE (UPF0316 family)
MQEQILTMAIIFIARILDVSIGTIRIIFLSRGYKNIAPLLGFFEVLIWLVAIAKVFQNVNTWYSYLIYAGGFATGNYIGMLIEEKLAIGYQSFRVITKRKASTLIIVLKNMNMNATVVNGKSNHGDVSILYIVVPKKRSNELMKAIKTHNPHAYVTIEDVRSHQDGFLSQNSTPYILKKK